MVFNFAAQRRKQVVDDEAARHLTRERQVGGHADQLFFCHLVIELATAQGVYKRVDQTQQRPVDAVFSAERICQPHAVVIKLANLGEGSADAGHIVIIITSFSVLRCGVIELSNIAWVRRHGGVGIVLFVIAGAVKEQADMKTFAACIDPTRPGFYTLLSMVVALFLRKASVVFYHGFGRQFTTVAWFRRKRRRSAGGLGYERGHVAGSFILRGYFIGLSGWPGSRHDWVTSTRSQGKKWTVIPQVPPGPGRGMSTIRIKR